MRGLLGNRSMRRASVRRRGAVAMGAVIAISTTVPLVFTSIDALPAEATSTGTPEWADCDNSHSLAVVGRSAVI